MYACDPIAIIISNYDYIDEVTGRYWFFDGQNRFGYNPDVIAEAIVTVGTANVERWHWRLGRNLFYKNDDPCNPNPNNSPTRSSLSGIRSYCSSEYDYPGNYYLDVTAYNSNNSKHDVNICTVCIIKCEIESNEYIGYESSTDFTYNIRPGSGSGWSYENAYFYIIDSKPSTGIENHIVYKCEISGFNGTVEWDGRGNYGSYESNNNFLSAGNYWAGIKIIPPGWPMPQRYSFPDGNHPNLKIREADIDADMDGDGNISVANDSDDDLWEENPGGYIGVDGPRKELEYYVDSGYDALDGYVRLAITDGNDKAKLYYSETGGEPYDYIIFDLSDADDYYLFCYYFDPYIQGIEASDEAMDIEVTLSYCAPGDPPDWENPIHSDKVKFTSIEADLGVDVDGDSDIDDDDDSGEDFPGGYVAVNGDRLFLDVNLNLLSSLNGIVSIYIYGYDKVELYNTPTGEDKIEDVYGYDGYYEWDLDDTTEYGEFNNICSNGLYIQGIEPSTSPQDIEISFEYYRPYTEYPDYVVHDTVIITSLELKAYIDEDKTEELEDWPEDTSQGLLRSPKYIFGRNDAIYVEVKNVGNNPSIVEYVHVKVASESDGTANLTLKETGPATNIFDNIATGGELLFLAASDSTGSSEKIKVIDEEVLVFSIEIPPYNSGNYKESYNVKVDRGEALITTGSDTWNAGMLQIFVLETWEAANRLNLYGWTSNGYYTGDLYIPPSNLNSSQQEFEQSKLDAFNSGGYSSSCSDVIQFTGHGYLV